MIPDTSSALNITINVTIAIHVALGEGFEICRYLQIVIMGLLRSLCRIGKVVGQGSTDTLYNNYNIAAIAVLAQALALYH